MKPITDQVGEPLAFKFDGSELSAEDVYTRIRAYPALERQYTELYARFIALLVCTERLYQHAAFLQRQHNRHMAMAFVAERQRAAAAHEDKR